MKQTKVPAAEPSSVPAEPAPSAASAAGNAAAQAEPARVSGPELEGITVPSVLLEGDEPQAGPRQNEPPIVEPSPPVEPLRTDLGPSELPKAYGTGQLLLMARDPGNLYAHWDLTEDQHRHYAELSLERQLQVRVHRENLAGPVIAELQVGRESNHGFIAVGDGGHQYVAELGYQPAAGNWQAIAASQPVVTPGAKVPGPEPARFGTLRFAEAPGAEAPQSKHSVADQPPELQSTNTPAPFDRQFPLPPPLRPISARSPQVSERVGLESLVVNEDAFPAQQPISAGTEQTTLPEFASWIDPAQAGQWTEAQERALAELIGHCLLRRQWVGSAEILELVRGRLPSAPPGKIAAIQSKEMVTPVSSGALGQAPAQQRGFWLNVNAELVLYGATQPDAQVTVGGQPIPLRADGTFSCRFALPDGFYQLPVVATSAQGEMRQAELDFSRSTDYHQAAGPAPQNPALKPPLAHPGA